MNKIVGWTLPVLALLAVGASAGPQPAAPGYHIVKKIELGGDGGWDYLTLGPDAGRLYIARSNRVMVVDVAAGKLVGEIPHTPGVHGIALAPKHGRGFISNGGESTVTVFDLQTLKETARVKVGRRPDAIIYDPATDRVFTFNAGSSDSSAIDAATNQVVGTVDLGGKPEFAVADGKGHVFVNIEDKNELVDFDAKNLSVAHRWSLAPGKRPSGLAMDRAKRRLFSTCGSGVMVVVDADSGKVLATPPIGRGTDACACDPATGLAFSSNGDGTLTVVRQDSSGGYTVAETVPTQAGARTMALDPKSHVIYLVTAKRKPGQRRSYEPHSFVVLVVGK